MSGETLVGILTFHICCSLLKRDVARMAEVHRGNVRTFVRQQCEAAEALVDRARKGALAAGAELVARHAKRVREEWEVTWAKRRQMDTAYSIP